MPNLRIPAAGAHISRVQAVVSALPCCVVAVSKESRFAVRERRGRWGKKELFVLVRAVGSAPRVIGALGCVVNMCGAIMS